MTAPTWTTRTVSMVANATTTNTKDTTIGKVLDAIRDGKWKARIEHIRGTPDKDTRTELKKKLPGIMPSGTFSQRNNDSLVKHVGLLGLDFDDLDAGLPAARTKIEADPHTAACFLSPSGNGLKVLVLVPPAADNSEHGKRWAIAAQHYAQLGLVADPQRKDISGLCFVSFDPDLFTREDPEPFAAGHTDAGTPAGEPEAAATGDNEQGRITAALEYIKPDDRDIWLKVGMALHWWHRSQGLPLWVEWSSRSEKFVEGECAKLWEGFAENRKNGVTLGTLFAYARLGGFNPNETPKADEVIARFNIDYAVVMLSSKCVVLHETTDARTGLPDLEFQKPEDFHAYNAPMKCALLVPYMDKKTKEIKYAEVEKAASRVWFEAKNRRTYKGVVFDPSGKAPSDRYNLWRGFAVEPKAGDWTLMRSHILHVICAGDKVRYRYLMAWLARIVQQPGGTRPGVAIVLRGKEGNGKGIFVRNFGDLLGGHYIHIADQMLLTGRFNGHCKDALLVFADEAFFAGDKTAVGKLKGLITEPTNFVEPKFVGAFPVANHINLIMASNEKWVVPAGEDARRFCVLDVSNEELGNHAYFAEIQRIMDSGGRAAMLHDLLALDISGVNLRDFPRTEALMDQKTRGLDSVGRFWLECLLTGKLSLTDVDGKPVYADGFDSYLDDKRSLYDGYLLYCRGHKVNHPVDYSHFFAALRDYCPGVSDVRRRKDGAVGSRQTLFPKLGICRDAFEVRLGGKIDWDEAAIEPEMGQKDLGCLQ